MRRVLNTVHRIDTSSDIVEARLPMSVWLDFATPDEPEHGRSCGPTRTEWIGNVSRRRIRSREFVHAEHPVLYLLLLVFGAAGVFCISWGAG